MNSGKICSGSVEGNILICGACGGSITLSDRQKLSLTIIITCPHCHAGIFASGRIK